VLRGNQLARKHPTLDEASPELRAAAAQMIDGIISDKGGAENMTTLEQAIARQACELWIMLELFKARIVRCGLVTPAGKVSPSYPQYLAGLDKFHKFANALGLDRRTRDVEDLDCSIEEYARRQEERDRLVPHDITDSTPDREEV
jgi:hypothetical protein